MMTVKMIIDLLKSYPEDLRVVVSGYEEGWDDLLPEQVSVIPVVPNTGKNGWQGRHLDADDLPNASQQSLQSIEVLALRRTSN